jgi:hypothetical protein
MRIKPIPGYESQYLIDEEGNVYSQARSVNTGLSGVTRQVGGRIIRPYYNCQKQLCVKLSKNNKRTTHDVKTLLRWTFNT